MPPASEIDAIFAEYDVPGSVGCALGVSLDGELVYKKGYGFANLDWDIPITSTTVFLHGLGLKAVHRRRHRPLGR